MRNHQHIPVAVGDVADNPAGVKIAGLGVENRRLGVNLHLKSRVLVALEAGVLPRGDNLVLRVRQEGIHNLIGQDAGEVFFDCLLLEGSKSLGGDENRIRG
jgi:hypothetical protein